MVLARWSPEEGRLSRVIARSAGTGAGRATRSVRPLPNVSLPPGRKFVLCDSGRCRGENCPFAHSLQEREAWNTTISK